jgi:hypothetical protein
VTLEALAADSSAAPLLYFKVCETGYWDCNLTEAEGRGAQPMRLVTTYTPGTTTAVLPHEPSSCGDSGDCTYLFATLNTLNTTRVLSLSIRATFEPSGSVELDKEYQNIVGYGHFLNYVIDPAWNPQIQPYLSSLKIKVQSQLGDADLFVSTDRDNKHPDHANSDYNSRRGTSLDEVTILEPSHGETYLGKPVYFSIFGATAAQVYVTFEYEFKPSYDERLAQAKPIAEGSFVEETLEDEYAEELYSFAPWWSGHEARSVVLLADVIQNRVFFYSQWNSYPRHFLSTEHDVGDTIEIRSEEPDYHTDGTYYIRLRPDFALYDLISSREYLYNMFAFSQPPAGHIESGKPARGWETLELGTERLGFSNSSSYQDYRFF